MTTMTPHLSPRTLRVLAVCTALTALTTFAVHLISFPTSTFEERLALSQNPLYLSRLWVVLLHIALVTVSMFGMALVLWRRSAMLTGLGFMGFLLFAWGEITRTAFAIFVLNRGWRTEFLANPDASNQDMLKVLMTSWGYLNSMLFFLFITGFTLGTLFYGLALLKKTEAANAWDARGWDARLGSLLLVWAVLNSLGAFGAAGVPHIPSLPDWFGWTFQPFARVCMAVWLWRKSQNMLHPSVPTV
jgi:hypothetical protein